MRDYFLSLIKVLMRDLYGSRIFFPTLDRWVAVGGGVASRKRNQNISSRKLLSKDSLEVNMDLN